MTRFVSMAAAVCSVAGLASAGMSLTDGFGDGDRDNDGALEGTLENAGDTGIEWYTVGGFTSSGSPKPELTVEDDSSGIGSGNALFAQARGGNGELGGFFGQTMSLGANIGDRLTLGFDIRLDPDNEPLSELTSSAEFRFGLYADSDNQLGTGGWGTSDGDFDSGSPGVGGDSGFFFRTPIGATPPATLASRIIYEPDNPDNIAGGSGTETIRVEDDFGGIFDDLAHRIEVTFERIAGAPGEDLLITFSIDGVSFSDTTVGEGLPMSADLASFDYFVAMTTQDQDWVLDNFSLAAVPVPAPASAIALGAAGLMGIGRRRR
ncbi:MAG: hypothetical protein AAGG07_06230 [Planctomycetota bacterium]